MLGFARFWVRKMDRTRPFRLIRHRTRRPVHARYPSHALGPTAGRTASSHADLPALFACTPSGRQGRGRSDAQTRLGGPWRPLQEGRRRGYGWEGVRRAKWVVSRRKAVRTAPPLAGSWQQTALEGQFKEVRARAVSGRKEPARGAAAARTEPMAPTTHAVLLSFASSATSGPAGGEEASRGRRLQRGQKRALRAEQKKGTCIAARGVL